MAETCVRAVKKALDALDYVALRHLRGEGATLSDIAGGLAEKPTTVRNILKTMEQCGYLARDGKAYVPGGKCGDVRRALAAGRWLDLLLPLMRRAAADTGDSFVATALFDGRREVLARVQGGGAVVVNVRTADDEPPYRLVTTRVMLSRAEPMALARFLAVNGPPAGDWPEAAGDGLEAALAALRRTGCARSETGAFHAYAVALCGADETLLGSVGAFSPAFRADAKHERLLLDTLRDIAEQMRR